MPRTRSLPTLSTTCAFESHHVVRLVICVLPVRRLTEKVARICSPRPRRPSTIIIESGQKRWRRRASSARRSAHARRRPPRASAAGAATAPRQGQQRRRESWERPARHGSVASSPRSERRAAEAARGGDPEDRGASAEEVGVEGRFGPCGANGHVDVPKCDWATMSDGVRQDSVG